MLIQQNFAKREYLLQWLFLAWWNDLIFKTHNMDSCKKYSNVYRERNITEYLPPLDSYCYYSGKYIPYIFICKCAYTHNFTQIILHHAWSFVLCPFFFLRGLLVFLVLLTQLPAQLIPSRAPVWTACLSLSAPAHITVLVHKHRLVVGTGPPPKQDALLLLPSSSAFSPKWWQYLYLFFFKV